MKTSADVMGWIKDNSISINQAKKLSSEERDTKFIMGKFVDKELGDYASRYNKVISGLKKD